MHAAKPAAGLIAVKPPQGNFIRGISMVESLPPQAYTERIRLPKFQRIRNEAEGCGPIWVKPGRTGLWTSSYGPENPEGICDWLRWCLAENFHTWELRWAYIYEVARPLRIVEIDSQADLHALNNEFGVDDPISAICHAERPGHPVKRWPNWERLARHFDAVHLTEKGQWATRLPPGGGDNLYGWDCESTLWLLLHRNTLRFVKKVRTNVRGPRQTRQEMREANAILMSRMRGWNEEARRRELHGNAKAAP